MYRKTGKTLKEYWLCGNIGNRCFSHGEGIHSFVYRVEGISEVPKTPTFLDTVRMDEDAKGQKEPLPLSKHMDDLEVVVDK